MVLASASADPVHGSGVLESTPLMAPRRTVDRPLIERARWLKHVKFFIGPCGGFVWDHAVMVMMGLEVTIDFATNTHTL